MKAFVKKEAVLCIALLCAMVSMLLVPPDGGCTDYVDYRVPALLFCLMLVVAGLQDCGRFDLLARYIFPRVGYAPLCTFACFFVFPGGLGRMAEVRTILTGFMERSTVATSALEGQVISNVPPPCFPPASLRTGRVCWWVPMRAAWVLSSPPSPA